MLPYDQVIAEAVELECRAKAKRQVADNIRRNCRHVWGEVQYTPDYEKEYTFPGDPPGTMGVDWHGPVHVPAKTTPKWTRKCKNCGFPQTTTRSNPKEVVMNFEPAPWFSDFVAYVENGKSPCIQEMEIIASQRFPDRKNLGERTMALIPQDPEYYIEQLVHHDGEGSGLSWARYIPGGVVSEGIAYRLLKRMPDGSGHELAIYDSPSPANDACGMLNVKIDMACLRGVE